jgi:hypothetical protein
MILKLASKLKVNCSIFILNERNKPLRGNQGFNPSPGAWKDSARVRGNAHSTSKDFKECVALQAQYIYDTYGKFPATAQSIFAFMYLQAHHLDLSFYDHYFKSGADLSTHPEHMKNWH